jgi:hypothetical protein
MNVSRLVGENSFTLAPDHELRRATFEETRDLKSLLETLMQFPKTFWWEYQLPLQGTLVHMPEAEWRYFVIEFSGTNHVLCELDEAFTLARVGLELGFTLLRSQAGGPFDGWTMNQGKLFHHLESRPLPFVDVSGSEVEQIRHLHERYVNHNNNLIDVKRLTRELMSMDTLPRTSPLRFLGYFATLESALTHNPKKTDTIDSITRQVKKKIALLDNRWSPRIDYRALSFEKPDKIWPTMYEYRSCLAHGGTPDFSRDLSLLKDHKTAFDIRQQTVKATIRQALQEPQLIADLKDC